MSVSVLLEGNTSVVPGTEETTYKGLWHFPKAEKTNVKFEYRWQSMTLPRELLDYVSFVPSPNDPVPILPAVGGRGRGRGRGRGGGRGGNRGGGRRPTAAAASASAAAAAAAATAAASAAAGSAVDSVAALATAAVPADFQTSLPSLPSSSSVMVAADVLVHEDGEIGEDGEEEDADADGDGDDGDDDDGFATMEDGDTVDDGMGGDVTQGASSSSSSMSVAMAGDLLADAAAAAAAAATAAAVSNYVLRPPVIIARSYPLFGLWHGTFEVVKGPGGETESVEETFFLHAFMGQDPPADLDELPPEPLFSTQLVPRKPLASASAAAAVAMASSILGQKADDADGAEHAGPGDCGAMQVDADTDADADGHHEGLLPRPATASAASVYMGTGLGGSFNEPSIKYLVGFGRNAFGRFSLSAVYNEVTGHLRCEKKYMTSKGSGRRGRRPGSTSLGGLGSRLSIESGGGLGGDGFYVPRPMSTRPRTSSMSSMAFFGDEDLTGRGYGGHGGKKRKSGFTDDGGLLGDTYKLGKDKGGGGSRAPLTALQQRERERERSRQRDRDREEALERELDDAEADYRVAFLDEESGEVYEGGWHPYAQRRHGMGVCLYVDGTIYEGNWMLGREHGRGQLLTGERHVIYVGEWSEGMVHGQGVYTFPNGDKYAGDWREGYRHGKGEYTTSNGCRFVGDWKDGKRHGKGVFWWADGSVYEGEWENDSRHGRGSLHLANGFQYDGAWVNNYMEGRGATVFPGGQVRARAGGAARILPHVCTTV